MLCDPEHIEAAALLGVTLVQRGAGNDGATALHLLCENVMVALHDYLRF